MAIEYLFAGVAVADLDAALAWYESFLGRPPDMKPNETEATWQVTGSGSIYVVADAARAGKALVTVMVPDLDAEIAGLTARGLDTAPVETVPGLYRKTVVEDPEGNRIQLAQLLGA
jgi:catechol 2,3-dioxygenase-like lactoylglutathione lyase family enzyme